MKTVIKQAELAAMTELFCFPLFLFTYTPKKTFFWILLILMDSFIVRHMNVIELLRMIAEKKGDQQLRRLKLLQLAILVCLGILAYKQLELACYLLLNDIALDVLSLLYHTSAKGKR